MGNRVKHRTCSVADVIADQRLRLVCQKTDVSPNPRLAVVGTQGLRVASSHRPHRLLAGGRENMVTIEAKLRGRPSAVTDKMAHRLPGATGA